MKLTRSVANLTLCILFILCLSVPLLEWWFSDDLKLSLKEKRPLAQLPSFTIGEIAASDYFSQFDDYYSDQFGFREKLVFFNNLIKYKAFGLASTNRVIPGKEKWLFFNERGDYQDYLPEFLYDDRQLELFAQVLETRRDWLESLGSRYLVVPIPNKADIYGEYLPSRIKKYKTSSRYDQIIDKLTADDRFQDVIDTRQILQTVKKQKQVYMTTDTHWNENGFRAVYEKIIARLKAYIPDIQPLKIQSEQIKTRPVSGDLAIMMNLRSVFTEDIPSHVWFDSCDALEEESYSKINKFGNFTAVPIEQYPVVSDCKDKKHKAIVIHDSFGLLLRPLLSQQFGTVIYSNYMEFNDLAKMIEFERPDVVIDLRVARNFRSLFEYDQKLEEKTLFLNKDKLTNLKMAINAQSIDKHLETSYNVEIKPAQRGLHLRAINHSPRLNFVFDEGPENTPLIVEIKLKSQHETSMALYYSSIGEREYTPEKSLTRPILTGENNIILRLPDARPQGKISFIPGHLTGDYELISFNVYRQPSTWSESR